MMSDEILTTVVGSYPVPAWLGKNPSSTALRDAVMVVLKTQEVAGIDVVSDGELCRFDLNHPDTNGMIDYFVRPMAGISGNLSRREVEVFRRQSGMSFRARPAGIVRQAIGEGYLDLVADFELVRGLTERKLKFTLTGPHMLSKTLLDDHYGDPSELAMAIAEVLRRQVEGLHADIVQIDEANVTGHPGEGHWAVEAINHVLQAVKGQKAVHLCFGNYGGQTIQKGVWADLLPFLNQLHTGHLVLEFARRGYDELEVFKELNPAIDLGLGVIDIKDNGVESPETVAQRIELAQKTLGPGRVRYVHPDCGLWMLHRSVADRKLRALVDGRDLFLGRSD